MKRGRASLGGCAAQLFAAVMAGEHQATGFRNHDLAAHLYSAPAEGVLLDERPVARYSGPHHEPVPGLAASAGGPRRPASSRDDIHLDIGSSDPPVVVWGNDRWAGLKGHLHDHLTQQLRWS